MPAIKGIFVADPCEFTATLGSESVTFVFDLSKMTLRRERDLKRSAESSNVDAMVADLLEVLISWDVLDETEQPVPISADLLLDLPAKALGNLIEGMSAAAQPSDAEGEASGALSSASPPAQSTDSTQPQHERAPTHQNGPSPSESHVPSASPS